MNFITIYSSVPSEDRLATPILKISTATIYGGAWHCRDLNMGSWYYKPRALARRL